ncbi:MAG: hypothetical protein ACT4O1_03395 [Gemmatimonadota bacterium]
MRSLIVAVALMLVAAPAHAQYGPPFFAGAGFGVGSFPHLFAPSCEHQEGETGIGPDIWAGFRLGNLRLAGRAALISDPRREDNCARQTPSEGTFVVRTYDHISDDATLLDLRALYGISINKLNASAGVHAGRVSERHSMYFGATAMLRYSVFGVATDFTRHNVKYQDVEWSYEIGRPRAREINRGEETVTGVFFKAFVEMTR